MLGVLAWLFITISRVGKCLEWLFDTPDPALSNITHNCR